MRRIALTFLVAAALRPGAAAADGLAMEIGHGVNLSSGVNNALFYRYYTDAGPLFRLPSYWETSVGSWNGDTHNSAVGFARGVRWWWRRNRYVSISLGLGYATQVTYHLGSHLQTLSRFAIGWRDGKFDTSVAFVHFSNAKDLTGLHGPNTGENFITIQLRRNFSR